MMMMVMWVVGLRTRVSFSLVNFFLSHYNLHAWVMSVYKQVFGVVLDILPKCLDVTPRNLWQRRTEPPHPVFTILLPSIIQPRANRRFADVSTNRLGTTPIIQVPSLLGQVCHLKASTPINLES